MRRRLHKTGPKRLKNKEPSKAVEGQGQSQGRSVWMKLWQQVMAVLVLQVARQCSRTAPAWMTRRRRPLPRLSGCRQALINQALHRTSQLLTRLTSQLLTRRTSQLLIRRTSQLLIRRISQLLIRRNSQLLIRQGTKSTWAQPSLRRRDIGVNQSK